MKIVNLRAALNAELVAALEDLLALAQSGDLHGLAFVAKIRNEPALVGLAGDYRRRRTEGFVAAKQLEQAVTTNFSSTAAQLVG